RQPARGGAFHFDGERSVSDRQYAAAYRQPGGERVRRQAARHLERRRCAERHQEGGVLAGWRRLDAGRAGHPAFRFARIVLRFDAGPHRARRAHAGRARGRRLREPGDRQGRRQVICCPTNSWSCRIWITGLPVCAGPPGPALADVDVGRRTGVLPHYSCRSVSAGFNRVTRSAGRKLAAAATPSKPSPTATKVSGSPGRTPQTRCRSSCDANPASTEPTITPASASATPGSATERIACGTVAPSASRIPSSRVRSATELAINP